MHKPVVSLVLINISPNLWLKEVGLLDLRVGGAGEDAKGWDQRLHRWATAHGQVRDEHLSVSGE